MKGLVSSSALGLFYLFCGAVMLFFLACLLAFCAAVGAFVLGICGNIVFTVFGVEPSTSVRNGVLWSGAAIGAVIGLSIAFENFSFSRSGKSVSSSGSCGGSSQEDTYVPPPMSTQADLDAFYGCGAAAGSDSD